MKMQIVETRQGFYIKRNDQYLLRFHDGYFMWYHKKDSWGRFKTLGEAKWVIGEYLYHTEIKATYTVTINTKTKRKETLIGVLKRYWENR